MAFNVTSNYAGKAFGQYISAALKEAKSLEGLTVLENIKYKENIRKMAGSTCLLYTSPSPRDNTLSRMPSSA